ncbi:M12 family metallopeptidase [Deinococcus fonticola]|uniref:M12 family metallopeptidase n=1 Tax=Deinococcus fonticola TaxID=2528713 RepID=UPI001075734B|nr:M12 family metallopeptidase [Deinococcus fonticola]
MKKQVLALVAVTLALASCSQQPDHHADSGDVFTPIHSPANLERQTPDLSVDLRKTPLASLSADLRARLSTEKIVRVILPNGKAVTYANTDGHVVLDGDMILGHSDSAVKIIDGLARSGGTINGQGLSEFAAGRANWGKTIPYFWNNTTFTSSQVSVLNSAISLWNQQIGDAVKWQWNTTPYNKVQFVNGGSGACGSSYVGMIGGTQPLTIGCFNTGTVIHEMGHAAGLHHEHQRCDRDSYVTVGGTDTTNFGRLCTRYQYGNYDYDSIMNYGAPYAYAKTPAGPYQGNPANLGRGSKLSTGDMSALRAIYPNSGTTDPTDPPPPTGAVTYTGTLASGGSAVHPSGGFNWYGGTLKATLTGPSGADFDLYLMQKYSDGNWYTMAKRDSPSASEYIETSQTAGIYRWAVKSYSGSGSYTLNATK